MVGCRFHRSACTKTRPDGIVVPRRKKGYEHPPPRVRDTISLSSFRVHHDATGQQSSASTEKKVTNTYLRASAIGCRCHRSACSKTRPDSRVVPRRKKSDEHLPPSGCGRMSLSSFRLQQNVTAQHSAMSVVAPLRAGEKVTSGRGICIHNFMMQHVLQPRTLPSFNK
ncbi:hypothetical protein TNCV_1999071 [Trichonephila clavipes]|nr:hypothetical protein TNCV_1999071 [Trichonephila clavipes]